MQRLGGEKSDVLEHEDERGDEGDEVEDEPDDEGGPDIEDEMLMD